MEPHAMIHFDTRLQYECMYECKLFIQVNAVWVVSFGHSYNHLENGR